jgi:hypothetical protein
MSRDGLNGSHTRVPIITERVFGRRNGDHSQRNAPPGRGVPVDCVRFHKSFNLILDYQIFPLILLGRVSELWSPTSAVERPSAPGGYFEGNLYYEMGMWVERCM